MGNATYMDTEVAVKKQVSLRGRTAKKVVYAVNHFPGLSDKTQNGERRRKINESEKEWECPDHLERNVFEMEHFSMELLHRKDGIADGIILQLHGGGYYLSFHNIYRDMAALYNEVSDGMDVLSVDYRVAPEFPYPAALEDAVEAYQWILDQGYAREKIFVTGDSAGGGLALALCLYLRDHGMPLPKGIITMSAWADLTNSGASYEENFLTDPVFGGNRDSLVYHNEYYRNDDPSNPYISPVYGEYENFPPMLMQVGEHEMLLSDTLTVSEKVRNAGVPVKTHIYKGMFHEFQMGLLLYPESREAWVEIGRFIRSQIKD